MLDTLGYFLLRGFAAFMRALPLDAALACGAWIGRIAYYCRTGKSIGYLNLKAAFQGEKTLPEIKRIARESLENLGRSAVEILRLPLTDKTYFEDYAKIPEASRVFEALEKKRGLIYLSPHFGNWELLHVRSVFLGVPSKVLVRGQKWGKISEYFDRLRTVHGSELIGRESSVKEFIRALQKGHTVAIAADQLSRTGATVEFFGRKTLAPAGFIEIARRTGSPILPIFDVRTSGKSHRVDVLPPLEIHGEDKAEDDLQHYYRILEDYIRKYPEQWLWEHKRWKFCFTKNILILSDGKAGHESQSRAVAEILESVKEDKPHYEFRKHVIRVEFRSPWHRYLLAAALPVMLPFIRSRIELLRFFLSRECYEKLAPCYADFVISCGSSLIPLSLLIAKENKARKILLMKPSFPFHQTKFDLIVAPRHDAPVRGKNVIYTEITPNLVSDTTVQKEAEKLTARVGLNGRRVVSIFIGGDTSRYSMQRENVAQAMDRILEAVRASDAQILVTTSRRTRNDIEALVKQKFSADKSCRLVVIANEANIENVTYGMMGVSDTVFVTEDSVSMISEAASSGKNVVILKVGTGRMAPKFTRFQQNLVNKNLARIVGPQEISVNCLASARVNGKPDPVEESRRLIREKMMEML